MERSQRRAGRWRALGPVRLVRHLMVLAMVFGVAFVAVSLSPDVTHTSGDIFESSGVPLLLNEVFFPSAAAMGAAFAGLFLVSRYVANGTYDPTYESTYWLRFVLGLISGMVLASLIPVSENSSTFSRPLLALLGGFSASVVYRILSRLVETLETLVAGDQKAAADVQTQAARVEADQQQGQSRMQLAGSVLRLREQAGNGVTQDELKAGLTGILKELLPGESYADLEGVRSPEPIDLTTQPEVHS